MEISLCKVKTSREFKGPGIARVLCCELRKMSIAEEKQSIRVDHDMCSVRREKLFTVAVRLSLMQLCLGDSGILFSIPHPARTGFKQKDLDLFWCYRPARSS